MSEILGYVFNPEASMSGLLIGDNKNKWRDGLKYLVMTIILLSFLTMAVYRLSGIHISDIVGSSLEGKINGLVVTNLNEGFAWIIQVIVSIMQTSIIIAVRFLAWTGMLYLASAILGERVSLYEASLISIFSMVVWVTAQIFGVITILIVSIMPIQIINEILMGLSTLLSYWYLVLMAIGFTIATKGTFLKGGVVILVIQGVFWMLGGMMPILQILLG